MKNVAFFRYPNEERVHRIASEQTKAYHPQQLGDVKGFVLQPFDGEKEGVLIPAEEHEQLTLQELSKEAKFHFRDGNYVSTNEQEYINYVQTGIRTIHENGFRKVVPARIKVLPGHQEPIALFIKACERYPSAFVSLVSTEAFGTWMGASPELLIHSAEGHVKTVALAGTQPANGKHPSEAVWTQKEIEEQALVSRYIINRFKQIRLREFLEEGPKTIKAGDLLHLKTSYHIDLREIDFDNLAGTLAELLHPTSATCGMPKEPAFQFILEHEPFDRELYTGYIGPVNVNGATDLYVNLRCAQMTAKNVVLYAGAGVTEDSNPQKEWLETEHKCAIMERLFTPPA